MHPKFVGYMEVKMYSKTKLASSINCKGNYVFLQKLCVILEIPKTMFVDKLLTVTNISNSIHFFTYLRLLNIIFNSTYFNCRIVLNVNFITPAVLLV